MSDIVFAMSSILVICACAWIYPEPFLHPFETRPAAKPITQAFRYAVSVKGVESVQGSTAPIEVETDGTHGWKAFDESGRVAWTLRPVGGPFKDGLSVRVSENVIVLSSIGRLFAVRAHTGQVVAVVTGNWLPIAGPSNEGAAAAVDWRSPDGGQWRYWYDSELRVVRKDSLPTGSVEQ